MGDSSLEQEVRHLKEMVDLRFTSSKEAIEQARERVNERLEGMNELRNQITNERGTYLTRERFDTEHGTLLARTAAIELQMSKWSGSIWMLGGAVSAVVILVNVALKMWAK